MNTKEAPTFEDIAVIEKATGGKITTYEWWTVRGVDGNFETNTKPTHEEDIIYHGVLENYFVSQGGISIGDYSRAQWYHKHRLKVYEPYPHGVAEAYNESGELEGYCGYTHRGAQIFRLGDRLFDEKYEPVESDYTPEEWAAWVKEYEDSIAEAEANGDTWWAEDIRRDGISRVITFKKRGSKLIQTTEEAAQAARNLSDHLS